MVHISSAEYREMYEVFFRAYLDLQNSAAVFRKAGPKCMADDMEASSLRCLDMSRKAWKLASAVEHAEEIPAYTAEDWYSIFTEDYQAAQELQEAM